MEKFYKDYVVGFICICTSIIIINLVNLFFNSKPLEITIALFSSFISILIAIVNLRESNLRFKEQIKISEENLKKSLKANEKNLKYQLIFNRKQEVLFSLSKELDEYKSILNKEYVEKEPEDIYNEELYNFEFNFNKLYNVIYNFRYSFDFCYCSEEFKQIILDLIEFVDECSSGDHFIKTDTFFPNHEDFYKSVDMLSDIYNQLQKEIITPF